MSPEPLVLAFDTSAAHCAAAVVRGEAVLAERFEEMARGQAERLMPLVLELLAEAGHAPPDLELIGVGTGPGNFTGTRISVAAARGLALALGIPAIGVTGLEAQAHGHAGVVVSTLPAPRDALYLQVLGGGETVEPLLTSLDTLPPLPARAEPACVGAMSAEIAQRTGGHVAEPLSPLAVAIARIAVLRRHSTTTRPAPLYLRPAAAEPPRDAPPVILP